MTTSKLLSAEMQSKALPKETFATLSASGFAMELRQLRRYRLAMVGLGFILLIVLTALAAPWLSPYPFDLQNLDQIRAAPSAQFLLGTDSLGRDLLSRVLYGARMALLVGVVVVTIELLIGVTLGMLAGYFGKRVDVVILTLTDMVWAFPPLILALGVIAALGPGLMNAVVALALTSWAPFTRVTRAKVMSLRQRDFVQASIAIGSGHGRILWRHILPNIIATNLVLMMLTLPGALLTSSALSFLGFGIQPPAADWGAMLSEGRAYLLDAPWITTFPGLAILLTVVSFNLLGDGVRDAFDPKQKG